MIYPSPNIASFVLSMSQKNILTTLDCNATIQIYCSATIQFKEAADEYIFL